MRSPTHYVLIRGSNIECVAWGGVQSPSSETNALRCSLAVAAFGEPCRVDSILCHAPQGTHVRDHDACNATSYEHTGSGAPGTGKIVEWAVTSPGIDLLQDGSLGEHFWPFKRQPNLCAKAGARTSSIPLEFVATHSAVLT